MALKDITKKIIEDAEAKKKEMMDQAKVKKSDIMADYKKRADDYRKKLTETADAEGESIKRGIVIDARQKVKNEELRRKRVRIDEVYTAVEGEFVKSADYPKIVASEIAKSASGKETVVVSRNEKALDQKWLDAVNKANKFALKFSSQKGTFKGGVVLQEGEAYINITVETLLGSLREDTESGIAKILFKEA